MDKTCARLAQGGARLCCQAHRVASTGGGAFHFLPAAVVVWSSLRNDAVNAGTESRRYNRCGDHGYIDWIRPCLAQLNTLSFGFNEGLHHRNRWRTHGCRKHSAPGIAYYICCIRWVHIFRHRKPPGSNNIHVCV